MLLWHLGATIAFVRYAFRDPGMDLRYLALGAIVADLVDLPLGIALWSSHETPRLAFHSLIVPASLMVAVLVFTSRGDRRKRWMLFTVGMLVHLALDGMWRSPETLWWPFLGQGFTSSGFATYGSYVSDLFSQPLMWAGEAIGIAYLIALWRRSGLSDQAARSTLITRGVVSARID